MDTNCKALTDGVARVAFVSRRPVAAILAAATLAATALVHSNHAAAEELSCLTRGADAEAKVINTTLAGVPAVVRLPKGASHRTVILWHGLGPPADPAALMQALPLDDVQAVKVYLGLPLTGTRAPKDGADSLAQRQKRDYGALIFKPVVIGAAAELPAVVAALREKHCLAKDGAVDLFGFSAGGSAVLFALTEQKVRIEAAITVNAPTGLEQAVGAVERATHQPYTWSPEAREVAEQTNFAGRAAQIARSHPALLMLQGADDSVSSPQDAEALVHALEPAYGGTGVQAAAGDASESLAASKQRIKVVVLPGVTHQWAQVPGLDAVRVNVAEWLNRYG